MPIIAESSVGTVLQARHQGWWIRAIGISGLAFIYGLLVGWKPAVIESAAYGLLQAIEFRAFSSSRPWWTPGSRGENYAGLALLAANSAVYGAPSLLITYIYGSWGDSTAVYLLCGCLFYSVLTTIGCWPAFRVSAYPYFIYLFIIPLNTPAKTMPLTREHLLCMFFGGGFLVFNVYQMWLNGSRIKQAEREAARRYVAERDETEQLLFKMTRHDAITGLLNRGVLQTRLAELVSAQAAFALLMIDLDGFKFINDTLGHSSGDTVLREIGRRLCRLADGWDGPGTAARLGGDEFALLLPGLAAANPAIVFADCVIAEIAQAVTLDVHPINIGASIGVVLHPLHGGDAEMLFANADLALYQAKAEGRHCARLYNPLFRALARGKVLRDTELRQALDGGEFEMFYQPKIRLCDGTLSGAEALLRWRHPTYGLLPPAEFLSALEGGLLSARVGDWVIQTACRQAAEWRESVLPDFTVAVNLFGAQFRSGNLVEWVVQACARAGLPADALEIEITENIILRHEDEVIGPLKELRNLGVGVAFDDYGTGFASLSMLTRFPVSRLKIDKSFTRAVCDHASETAVIHAMIGLAKALDLTVTAEGVETQAQADALRLEGCDEAQGYYYGRPMSAAAFYQAFVAPKARIRA